MRRSSWTATTDVSAPIAAGPFRRRRGARPAAAGRQSIFESLEARAYFSIQFGSPTELAVAANDFGTLQAPVIGDFNNDGKLDLVFVDASTDTSHVGMLTFAAGNGSGSFTVGTPFSGGVFGASAASGSPTVVGVAGDFNGDGNLDLALPNSFGSNISIMFGNGDGTFVAPTAVTTGTEPLALGVGDFNGDGRDDIAVGNRTSGTVTVLLGATSGPPTNGQTLTVGSDPASLVVGDFNGDGQEDLVVGNAGTPSLQTFLGTGTGTFGTTPVTTAGPHGVTGVGDFNADGKLDVAVSVSASGTPTVLLGNGDGTFQANGTLPSSGFSAIVADFDHNGSPDIASSGANNQVAVLLNNGSGQFASPATFSAAQQTGAASAGDFNADGLPDFAVAGISGSNRVVDVLLNQGLSADGPDLTADVLTRLPGAVVGGAKGKVGVRITNKGNQPLGATPVAVTLYASPDGTLNGATSIATQTKKLKLKVGKSKVYNIKFKYPSGIADGNYTIVAQADSTSAVNEGSEANNLGASATQVNIAAPFIDLAGTFAQELPSGITSGSKQSVSVLVTNAGNVTAKGPVTLTLSGVAGLTAPVTFGSITKNLSLKANGGKKTLKLKFVVPQSPPGTYTVSATVTSAGPVADTVPGNNTVVASTPVTIA